MPKTRVTTLYAHKVTVRPNSTRPACGCHLEEKRIEPRQPVETHMEVDVGEAVAGEITRPLDLCHQFAAQLARVDLTSPEFACEVLVEEVPISVNEATYLTNRQDGPANDGIQMTSH